MTGRIATLLLLAFILTSFRSPAPADDNDTSEPAYSERYEELMSRIETLRMRVRYDGALALAETLYAEQMARPDARPDERGDAARLVTTLKSVVRLPPERRFEMAIHDSLLWVADSLHQVKDYAAALPILLDLKSTRERYLGPRDCETIDAVQFCAVTLDYLLRFDEAEVLYRRSLADSRRVLEPGHPLLVTRSFDFASFYRVRFRYREASLLFDEALRLAKTIRDPKSKDLAYDLEQYGGFRLEVGDLAGAREAFQEAMGIFESNEDEPNVIRGKSHLAKVCVRQGDLYQASELLGEALTYYEAADPRSIKMAGTLHQLALVSYEQGNFSDAQAMLERSLSIKRERNADPVSLATTVELLGSTLMNQGRLKEAESYISEAIVLWTQVHGENSLPVMASFEALATVRFHENRNSETETLLVRAAAIYDSVRMDVSSGTDRAVFRASPYEKIAAIRLLNGDDERAWPAVESHLARTLKDEVFGGDSDAFGASMLASVQESIRPKEAIVGWVDAVVLLGASARRSAAGFTRELPVWAYCVRDRGPVTWTKLKPSTDRDLIAALRDLKTRLTNSAAMMSDSDLPWADRLRPVLTDVESIAHLTVIPSGDMLGVPVEALLINQNGTRLGERIEVSYAPSATVLAWLRRSRDEHRNGECRACLSLGDPPFNEEQSREMRIGGVECAEGKPLHAAAPDAGTDQMVSDPLDARLRGADPDALNQLRRLRWTRCEARDVAEFCGSVSMLLLGEDASEARIRGLVADGSMSKYCIVHIATHGLVDEERPERSALVISQVGLPDPVETKLAGSLPDGRITVEEIDSTWKLDAGLVALSACSSGLGRPAVGEGYLGFSQALLKAGANCVLVSLWKVDDQATATLMQRFYDNWLGRGDVRSHHPKTKAQALQEAKAWLRSDTPYRHPFFWAGFVLIGDAR